LDNNLMTGPAIETHHDQRSLPAHDPLSGASLKSCRHGSPEFLAATSPEATETPVSIGPGLRGVRRTSPDSPIPVIGIHNPTETVREFMVDPHFPDVAAGKARLVFIGGAVETVGAPDESPRFRLRPGAHLWLAQTSHQDAARATHRSSRIDREQDAFDS
jgi:hypothetical protein